MTNAPTPTTPRRRTSPWMVLWLAAAMSFPTVAWAAEAGNRVNVHAPDTVHVNPEHLQLLHVAAVTGGDPELRQATAGASIGDAPAPGKTRLIDKADIVAFLQKAGVAPEHVRLDMPDRIAVHRNAVTISEAFLERIVTGYLLDRAPWPREHVRVERFSVDGDTLLPSGRITYRVMESARLDFLRPIHLTVAFFVDGVPRDKTRVTVNLSVGTPVVVTSHPIGRNQSISEEDIKMVTMDLAELPSGVITNPDDVIGLRARRTLHIDTPLREDLVEQPPLVDRGDIVKIVLEGNGLRVSTLGEVKEKGRRGERISVVNLASNRRVLARVVDSKTVKVDY